MKVLHELQQPLMPMSRPGPHPSRVRSDAQPRQAALNLAAWTACRNRVKKLDRSFKRLSGCENICGKVRRALPANKRRRAL